MPELQWPDGRGRFVDRDGDRVDDPPRVVQPGGTVDVDDDTAAHYQDRGFVAVDADPKPSADDEADSESQDGDGEDPAPDGDGNDGDDGDGGDSNGDDGDTFDVESFLDRTPVEDVVDDIEAGQVDGHLDAVEDAADRVTVERAIDDRQDTVERE